MIRSIIKLFFSWRLFILAITLIAIPLLPFKFSFPYAEVWLKPTGHPAFWSLANFDGVHYLGIAQKGYFAQFTQAFFPLYPLLIRWVNFFVHNLILSGYFISHLSFLAFLILLYRLISLDFSKTVARHTLLLYLVFPTSFFFAAIYSESLFLFLVIASFYSARKKNWLLATSFAALASATKIFGILLLPALLIEFWQQHKKRFFQPQLLLILLSSLGLLLYMRHLAIHFSDPLYFLHAQPAFGASRSGGKLILLYQVVWRYLKMITTVDTRSLLYFTVSQEFYFSLIFLFLSLLALKTTRVSYAVFGLLTYLLPTLTGTFSSMPRYVLTIFPAFIVLGKIRNKAIRYLLYAISLGFLVLNTALFTRGYWVA